jgi:enoyl-CoA hydratase/carnithine racemase
MNEKLVLLGIDDNVATISLNRPSRHNAMTDEAQAALLCAIQSVSADNRVRSVLLRGEGKSLCAGRDTSILGRRQDGDSDYIFVRRAQQIQHAIFDCPKPIVASIKGAAIGGGFEFALACDMRVVSRDAKMSLPEITYGLLPDMGGTQTLTSIIGRSKSKYYVMSGDSISGVDAHDWGIADWLAEDGDDADSQAYAIAQKIAKAPPQNLMMAKSLVDQFWVDGIRRGLSQELTSITTLFKTADYLEARNALKEKRAPKFTGK